jgi:hypothetical protein
MALFQHPEERRKIDSEKEKAVLLCLYDGDRTSIRDVAKQTKNYGNDVSKTGVAKILDRFVELGVVRVKSESENKFSLNRNKVYVKSFDMELLKQLMTPAAVALFFICFPVAFMFVTAVYIAVGGVLVFLPQLVYSMWKILRIPAGKEVFVMVKEKPANPTKWQFPQKKEIKPTVP